MGSYVLDQQEIECQSNLTTKQTQGKHHVNSNNDFGRILETPNHLYF